MFCPQCGHKNEADYRFCGGCGGARQDGAPTQASSMPPPAGFTPPPPVAPPPPVIPPVPPVGTGGMPPTMRFEPPPAYPTPPVAAPRGGGGGGAMVLLIVVAVLALGGLAVWKIGEHSRSDSSASPSPSVAASESPSPTVAATGGPTGMPTTMPTGGPGGMPTGMPTGGPGGMPTGGPGGYPTAGPGDMPSDLPTVTGAQTSVMIDQAVMCDAVTGSGAPVNPVQAYGPRQNFYVSMKAYNLRVGTWIVAAFRGPGYSRDSKLDSNRQGNYYCAFMARVPTSGWEPGTYQVFIIVDGTLKNTLTFQVTP